MAGPAWSARHGLVTVARGFTLIEAAIVVAVAALLAALAWPSLAQQLDRQRLRAAAEALASDLTEARHEAAQRGVAMHLRLQPGAPWCYAIVREPGCGCAAPSACQLKRVVGPGPAEVTLTASTDVDLLPDQPAAKATVAVFRGQHGGLLEVHLSALGRSHVCAGRPVSGVPAC